MTCSVLAYALYFWIRFMSTVMNLNLGILILKHKYLKYTISNFSHFCPI